MRQETWNVARVATGRRIKLGYSSGETVADHQLPVRRYRTAANALGGKRLGCATVNVLNKTANPMPRQVPRKDDLLAIGHPVDHVPIALDPLLIDSPDRSRTRWQEHELRIGHIRGCPLAIGRKVAGHPFP